MKRIITILSVLAVSTMFTQAADAPAAPGAPAAPAADAPPKKHADPEAQWKKIAGDKESVTKEEFTAHAKTPEAKAKAEALFDKKDTNHDGKLTKEEFLAKGGKKNK
jgi:hypothetical protein